MISMTMFSDYSPTIAHGVDEDTDDLEPVDPSVFFGTDDDDDLDEDEGIDIDEDEDEELADEEEF